MAQLEELVLKLSADAAELRSTLKTVEGDIGSLVKSTEKSSLAMRGLFVLEAGKAAFDAIRGGAQMLFQFAAAGAQAAEEANDLAASLGVNTQALLGLQYAAGQTGTKSEELSRGLVRLARSSAEAYAGVGDSAKVFAALGISVRDSSGGLKDVDTLFGEVADGFRKLADGSGKAAIAVELFGKGGERLIPMLNEGRTALEALEAEAKKYGITLSQEVIAGSERFNAANSRLESSSKSFGAVLASQLAPAWEAFVSNLGETGSFLTDLGAALGLLLGVVERVVLAFFEGFGLVYSIVAKTMYGVSDIISNALSGDWTGTKEAAKRYGDDMADSWSRAGERTEKILFDWNQDTKKGLRELSDTAAQELARAKSKTEEEGAKAVKALQGVVNGYREQIEGLRNPGGSESAKLDSKLFGGSLADELAKGGAAAQQAAEEARSLAREIDGINAAAKRRDILEHFQNIGRTLREQTAALRANDSATSEAAKARAQLDGDPKFKQLRPLDRAFLTADIIGSAQEKDTAAADAKRRDSLKALAGDLDNMREARLRSAGATNVDRVALELNSGSLAKHLEQIGRYTEEGRKYIRQKFDEADALDRVTEQQERESLSRERHDRVMADAARLYEDSLSPMQKYERRLREISDAHEAMDISAREAFVAEKAAVLQYQKDLRESSELAQRFSHDAADIFVDSFKNGFDSIGDMFAELISRMLLEAASAKFAEAISGIVGGFGESLFKGVLGRSVGSIGAGGGTSATGVSIASSERAAGFKLDRRAAGGPVSSSRSYLVGEEGPELFAPDVSGHIIPTHRLQSDARGPTAPSQTTLRLQLDQKALRMTMNDWLEGALGDALASR